MNLNLKNEVTYCYRPTAFAQALLILLRNCIGFGNGSPNEKGDHQGRLFCQSPFYTAALRNVAINAAAPMNSPAKVRFMRFCCFGVRNRRSTLDARPV
jgi:hypothetical protein